jgi:hypothetical protein
VDARADRRQPDGGDAGRRRGGVDERAGGGNGQEQGKAPVHSHSLASSSDRSNLRTSRVLLSDSGSLTS